MKSLKIKSLESKDNSVFVSWESNFDEVSVIKVVLDDDGSSTNLGVDPKATSATVPGVDSGKYLITVSALTSTGWVNSQTLVVSV